MKWGLVRLRNKILQLRLSGRPMDSLARQNLHCLDRLRPENPAREQRFVVYGLRRTAAARSLGAFRVVEDRVMLGEVFEDRWLVSEHESGQAASQGGADGPRRWPEVFEDFLAFIGGDVLVAHQAASSAGVLHEAMRARSGFGLQNPTLDTMEISRHLLRGQIESDDQEGPKYALEQVARLYNLEMPQERTALGDALTTALIFQRLLQKMAREGDESLLGLMRIGGAGS